MSTITIDISGNSEQGYKLASQFQHGVKFTQKTPHLDKVQDNIFKLFEKLAQEYEFVFTPQAMTHRILFPIAEEPDSKDNF